MGPLRAYLIGTSIADAGDLGALEGENMRLRQELQQALEDLRVMRANTVGYRTVMRALKEARRTGNMKELDRLVFDREYARKLFGKAYDAQYECNEPLG